MRIAMFRNSSSANKHVAAVSPCHNQIQMYCSNQILLAYVITEYEMYNHSSTLFLIIDVFILSCLLRILKV